MFDDVADINVVITLFAILGGLAQLLFLANFFISIYRGQKAATQNPWKSNTLEWTTPVEHIHGNWPGKFQKFTVGLMIIVRLMKMENTFTEKILYYKQHL